MALFFTVLAGVIHVYIFVLESILWGSPKVNKIFNTSSELAQANRLFAFNQGFYNLFLAFTALIGVGFYLFADQKIGMTLIISANASILGAAIVLLSSIKKLVRAVFIQGLAPLLALLSILYKFIS